MWKKMYGWDMPTISIYKLIRDMNGGAAQVQHDMVADQRNYGWNYDAALRSMWLKEGCCSDAEEREVHTTCLRCVSVPGAIIGGLFLCMISVYNPPHLEASGFYLHSPVCRQRRVTKRHAGYRSRMSQWACAATVLLPSPSTYFCSPFPCVDVSQLS